MSFQSPFDQPSYKPKAKKKKTKARKKAAKKKETKKAKKKARPKPARKKAAQKKPQPKPKPKGEETVWTGDFDPTTGRVDRWRERQWHQAIRGRFRKGDYEILYPKMSPSGGGLDLDIARAFVSQHHYAGGLPQSVRFAYGLYHKPTKQLVGVAAYGSGPFGHVLPKWFHSLKDPHQESSELVRLVLLDMVPKDAESWFVSKTFRHMARRLDQQGVISFSDPSYGHVGTIYQALGAHYTGQGKADTVYVFPDGSTFHPRNEAKIRAADPCHGSGRSTSGWKAQIDKLVAMGAPRPRGRFWKVGNTNYYEGACLQSWLTRSLALLGAAKTRRPAGKYRYLWGLSDTERKRLGAEHPIKPAAYPKHCYWCGIMLPSHVMDEHVAREHPRQLRAYQRMRRRVNPGCGWE